MGPGLHLALPNTKTDIIDPNTIELDPKAETTNYSLKETAAEPSPLHTRSDTRIPVGDQWHGSQWQRDRLQTDLQTQ